LEFGLVVGRDEVFEDLLNELAIGIEGREWIG
jgi:hypothetical protein